MYNNKKFEKNQEKNSMYSSIQLMSTYISRLNQHVSNLTKYKKEEANKIQKNMKKNKEYEENIKKNIDLLYNEINTLDKKYTNQIMRSEKKRKQEILKSQLYVTKNINEDIENYDTEINENLNKLVERMNSAETIDMEDVEKTIENVKKEIKNQFQQIIYIQMNKNGKLEEELKKKRIEIQNLNKRLQNCKINESILINQNKNIQDDIEESKNCNRKRKEYKNSVRLLERQMTEYQNYIHELNGNKVLCEEKLENEKIKNDELEEIKESLSYENSILRSLILSTIKKPSKSNSTSEDKTTKNTVLFNQNDLNEYINNMKSKNDIKKSNQYLQGFHNIYVFFRILITYILCKQKYDYFIDDPYNNEHRENFYKFFDELVLYCDIMFAKKNVEKFTSKSMMEQETLRYGIKELFDEMKRNVFDLGENNSKHPLLLDTYMKVKNDNYWKPYDYSLGFPKSLSSTRVYKKEADYPDYFKKVFKYSEEWLTNYMNRGDLNPEKFNGTITHFPIGKNVR